MQEDEIFIICNLPNFLIKLNQIDTFFKRLKLYGADPHIL